MESLQTLPGLRRRKVVQAILQNKKRKLICIMLPLFSLNYEKLVPETISRI